MQKTSEVPLVPESSQVGSYKIPLTNQLIKNFKLKKKNQRIIKSSLEKRREKKYLAGRRKYNFMPIEIKADRWAAASRLNRSLDLGRKPRR